ncbi:amidinotransferase, partial [bacterium]|nr:amidinotransferase [bacterium]
MLRSEGERLKRVVVCTPRHEYACATNLEKHNIGNLGNPKVAIQQHDRLKAKLREFNVEVVDIAELNEHPNSV